MKRIFILLFLISRVLFSCTNDKKKQAIVFYPQESRIWLGPELWANRLQDWRVNNGRIECIETTLPMRTAHILTRQLKEDDGYLLMSVDFGIDGELAGIPEESFSGFLLGAGGTELDYRSASLVHHGFGNNGGMAVGVNNSGELICYYNDKVPELLNPASYNGSKIVRSPEEKLGLSMKVALMPDNYNLIATVKDIYTGKILQEARWEKINPKYLIGNIAIVAHCYKQDDEGGKPVFWFNNLRVSGSKVEFNKSHLLGPIISSMFTVSKGIMKMTAQMAPIGENDQQFVTLEIDKEGIGSWEKIADAEINTPGWTSTFSIPGWNSKRNIPYMLVYQIGEEEFYYEGVIPKDPVNKEEIVVAAFACQSQTFGRVREHFDFDSEHIWFPHPWLKENVTAVSPDILAFTGDQVYEARPTKVDNSGNYSSYLDYMYKWYLFCWAHRDLLRGIPTICIPDDHDVYHGNLWGEGGKKCDGLTNDGKLPENPDIAKIQFSGGYFMPPEFVRMVERTQTSHLPDPYYKGKIKQDLTTYYTDLLWGGISFAVLEDRKFKSGPRDLVSSEFNNPSAYDLPGLTLLGDNQVEFLNNWSSDWQGAWMKIAVSQTIFANAHTEELYRDPPSPMGIIPEGGYEMYRDFDTNGWPKTGRDKALKALRKGFALSIGGDQHLATIIHMGVDEWEDASFSLCAPAIANLYPRRWFPKYKGENHIDGMPEYTGRYVDSFGNKITVWAAANPYQTTKRPKNLHEWATGFVVARLNKKTQKITMECWPHYSNPSDLDAEQFPGWPKTIDMEENYARKADAWLPEIRVNGLDNPPVVQVIDELSGEIIYTLRIKGDSFTPKVFKEGVYTIKVGEPGTKKMKALDGIRTSKNPEKEGIVLIF